MEIKEMPWFRFYGKAWIFGPIRQELDITERAIFVDLLALASASPVKGRVCISERVPYPPATLAEISGVEVKILKATLRKLEKLGKITVDKRGIIEIVKWRKLQSRYYETKDLPSQKGSRGVGLPVGLRVGMEEGVLVDSNGVGTSYSPSKSLDKIYKEIEEKDPLEVYRLCFRGWPSALTQHKIADLMKKYGKQKVIRSMIAIGEGGYRFGNVEKHLEGRWNESRSSGKSGPSRDNIGKSGEVV